MTIRIDGPRPGVKPALTTAQFLTVYGNVVGNLSSLLGMRFVPGSPAAASPIGRTLAAIPGYYRGKGDMSPFLTILRRAASAAARPQGGWRGGACCGMLVAQPSVGARAVPRPAPILLNFRPPRPPPPQPAGASPPPRCARAATPLSVAPIAALAWRGGRRGGLAAAAALPLHPALLALLGAGGGELLWRPQALVGTAALALVGEAIGHLRDLTTRLRAAEARLAHQATHDPLTGLPNRALLRVRLAAAAALAVLALDLDDLKRVNDTRGHAAALRLRRAARGGRGARARSRPRTAGTAAPRHRGGRWRRVSG